MSSAWQFLSDIYPGSRYDQHGYWISGAAEPPAAESWMTPLTQYGVVAIDGPDGSKFLQGQTSCDWRQISDQQSGRGSYCNIKGRILNSFLASMPGPDRILLRMRADTTASFCTALAKYIVFSKAKMRDASAQFLAFGVAGPQARSTVESWLGASPEGQLQQITRDKGVAIQLDATGHRFECLAPAEQMESLWRQLSASLVACNARHWERLNIEAGLGEVCAATQDMFIPQMLNMQLTGGVSFKKGCYTGQEVIARMEYRGKLKRRMYHAQIPTQAALPTPGMDICLQGQDQSIGKVVVSAPDDQHIALLVVLTNESATSDSLHVGGDAGPRLSLLDLPYEVPEKI